MACPFKGSKKNIPLIHSHILILPINLLLLSYHLWPGTLAFIQSKSKFIMGICGLIVCLGEYPHGGPFIMIPSPNRFSPQIVTCLSLHQPWRMEKSKGRVGMRRKPTGKETSSGMRNWNEKSQKEAISWSQNLFYNLLVPFFSFPFPWQFHVYPNAIFVDHPACLVHCHITQFMTAIPGKSKVTKWTSQEVLISPADQLALFISSLTTHLPLLPLKMKLTLEGIRCTKSQQTF